MKTTPELIKELEAKVNALPIPPTEVEMEHLTCLWIDQVRAEARKEALTEAIKVMEYTDLAQFSDSHCGRIDLINAIEQLRDSK